MARMAKERTERPATQPSESGRLNIESTEQNRFSNTIASFTSSAEDLINNDHRRHHHQHYHHHHAAAAAVASDQMEATRRLSETRTALSWLASLQIRRMPCFTRSPHRCSTAIDTGIIAYARMRNI